MNDQDSSFDFGGIYAFTSLENFVQNRAGTFEGQAPGSTTARRWRQDLIGLYAQDDWIGDAQSHAEPRRALRVHHHAERARRPEASALPDLQAANFVTGRRRSSRTRR